MYKFSYTSKMRNYIIEKNIKDKIYVYTKKIKENIEFSILYKIYDETKILDFNSINSNTDKSLLNNNLIHERLLNIACENNCEDYLISSKREAYGLIIPLYEYLLREEMVKYSDSFFDNNKNVQKEKKSYISFKDYKESKDNHNYLKDYIDEYNKIINSDSIYSDYYIHRPTYFLLNRIRTNILENGYNAYCSYSHFEKIFKYIDSKFESKYIELINTKYFDKVINTRELRNEILKYIKTALSNSLMLGKNFSKSNDSTNTINNQIFSASEFENLEEMANAELQDINEYRHFLNYVSKYQKQYIQLIKRYVTNETNIRETYLKNDVNNFICNLVSNKIVEHRNDILEFIEIDEIENINKEIIRKIKNRFLKKEKYNVFLKLYNCQMKEEYLNTKNAKFISNNYINLYLNEIYKCDNLKQKMYFFDDNKEQIYAEVNNIYVYKNDMIFTINKAKKEVEKVMNYINFYTSNKNSKDYKFGDGCFIFKDKIKSYSEIYNRQSGIFNVKLINNESFYSILSDKSKEKYMSPILDTIKELEFIQNSNDMHFLSNSNKKMLNSYIKKDMEIIISIIIAGSNNYKYENLNYGKLRFWLVDDYKDFFSNSIPNDNFLFERYITFYKKCINIILSYLDVFDDKTFCELINWILKVFPNEFMLTFSEEEYE